MQAYNSHGNAMGMRPSQDIQAVSASRAPAYPGYERNVNGLGGPVESAKKSLEMLTALCEQSTWQWIEGMLLGGCLHYGLENYEKALDWFSRITSLEPR